MSHRIQRSALLPHSAQQMFELVDAVERYAEFVPGVEVSEVHSRDAETLVATLTLQRAGVRLALRTRNLRYPNERLVMTLEDGPFRHFGAEWRFKQLGDAGVKVEFEAEFELARVPFASAAAKLIESVAGRLVDAFRIRAAQVYGAA